MKMWALEEFGKVVEGPKKYNTLAAIENPRNGQAPVVGPGKFSLLGTHQNLDAIKTSQPTLCPPPKCHLLWFFPTTAAMLEKDHLRRTWRRGDNFSQEAVARIGEKTVQERRF